MKVKNSSNITLEVIPWTDKGNYRITKLQLIEGLGGMVPKGTMSMEHIGSDEALELITDESTATIKLHDDKENGIQYEIPIFITKKSNFNNIFEVEFVCISDKKFFTDLISTSYDSIKDAIQTVYPGNKDIRVEPDSGVDGITEYQADETGYDFCKRLCYSYKTNTVFAFGWEGLMIKELIGIDSRGNKEPSQNMTGNKLMFNTTPYELNYNKLLNHEPYDPWIGTQDDDMLPTTKKDYSSVSPKNVSVLMEYSDYSIIGKQYQGHIMNSRFNERLMNSNMYTDFVIKSTDLPPYKIGDVIKWNQPPDETTTNPFNVFLVKSNELFWTSDDNDGEVDWTGLRLSWTTILTGLQKGTWSEDKEE